MAAWLIPALKAVLPHVGSIISATAPVFTKKKQGEAVVDHEVLQQQIAELQAAASRNAEHVKDLAAQLQRTVAALEEAATVAQARLRRVFLLCSIAVAAALFATVLSLVALLAG